MSVKRRKVIEAYGTIIDRVYANPPPRTRATAA